MFTRANLLALACILSAGPLPGFGDEVLFEKPRSANAPAATADQSERTHKQIASLAMGEAGQNLILKDFCVHREGQVLALVGPGPNVRALSKGNESEATARSEVRLFKFVRKRDLPSTAELEHKWPLDFEAEAINISPEGVVYVGGAGKIARYQLDGTLLSQVKAPQIAAEPTDPEELKRQAEEMIEAQKAAREEQIKQIEQAQQEEEKRAKEAQAAAEKLAAKKPDGEKNADGATPKRPLRVRVSGATAVLQALRRQPEPTVEDVIKSIRNRLSMVNSISIGPKHVFIACPESKGYGYAIWRTDLDLTGAKKIVSGLSGCCGQMDLQASGDEFYVAENSRHRVVRYNSDGKKLGSFGKRDREGVGENFGGCCNPMNLCFTSEGEMLVSESNGIVKRFTTGGEYVGMVGAAGVPEGCKNSAVAVSSDGDYVFYIDVRNSKILVLERQPATGKAAG